MSVWNALKAVGRALAALEVTEGVLAMTDNDERREDATGEDRASPRTLVEEIEVEAEQLVKRVKELIRAGNVRTLRIKDAKGKYLIEVPLTVGVLAGGIFALAAPTAAALSAIAGLFAKVTIEVVREAEGDDEPGDEQSA